MPYVSTYICKCGMRVERNREQKYNYRLGWVYTTPEHVTTTEHKEKLKLCNGHYSTIELKKIFCGDVVNIIKTYL